MHREAAAQLLGRNDTTVQAKSVSGFFGRESMRENAREILGRNSDAIVDHGNPDPVIRLSHAQG